MPPNGVSTCTFLSSPLASLSTCTLKHPAIAASSASPASKPVAFRIPFCAMAFALLPCYTPPGVHWFLKITISTMELPRRDQRVVAEPCTQSDVERGVDRPSRQISYCHLPGLSQDIPQEQQIQRDQGGKDGPARRVQAHDAVPHQAHKTAYCQRCKHVQPFVGDIEPQPPRERCEQDRNIEQNWCWQRIEHHHSSV